MPAKATESSSLHPDRIIGALRKQTMLQTLLDYLKYLLNSGLARTGVYALLTLLPLLIFFCAVAAFGKKVSMRQIAFLNGCGFLLAYAICVLVPFYFQGYDTMPLTYETSHNPSGLPSVPPFGLLAYIFGMPWFGCALLFLSATMIVFGKVSENRVIDVVIRAVLVCSTILLMCNLGNYARVSVVLDI